jgi:hypothetical protein
MKHSHLYADAKTKKILLAFFAARTNKYILPFTLGDKGMVFCARTIYKNNRLERRENSSEFPNMILVT